MNGLCEIIRKQVVKSTIMVVILLSPFAPNTGPAEPLESVRIGILTKGGDEVCLEKWNPTAEYLSQLIPNYKFEIVPLGYGEIYIAVEQEVVDFILVNPSYYVALEMQYGASRIATIKNMAGEEFNTFFGGVIFSKNNRADIVDIRDFKDKTFMTVHKNALGAWHSVWRELYEKGFNPLRDFASVEYSGSTHDSVVYAVRDGIVDIGAVRSGILERMNDEKKIDIIEFKIFHLYKDYNSELSCLISTRLYPEWPIAKLKNTSLNLAEEIASALLKMSPTDSAAVASECAGWSIPLNYQSVHECLKTLRAGPYEDLGKVPLKNVLSQYWQWFLGSIFLVVLIILFTVYIIRLNQKLRKAVIIAEDAARKRNEAVRLAEETAKLASIGVMAAGITHEINQPLNAIRLSADGIILWDEKNPGNFPEFLLNLVKEISGGSKRISAIIEHMRSFWSTPVQKVLTNVDINKALLDALELNNRQIKNHQIKLDLQLGKESMTVLGDTMQMQQIINNLVINAIHALDETQKTDKWIRITTRQDDNYIILEISDNGSGLPAKTQDELFNPFYSTRSPEKGMGLGLAIVRMFVDRSDGNIEARNNAEGGATFTIRFYSVKDKERID